MMLHMHDLVKNDNRDNSPDAAGALVWIQAKVSMHHMNQKSIHSCIRGIIHEP